MPYNDSHGMQRGFHVTAADLERIEAKTGVDLFDLSQLGEAASKPLKMARICYVASRPHETKETWEQWASAHVEDALHEAFEDFTEALIRFFPKRLQEMFKAEADLQTEFANLSTSSPELSESTQAD